MAIKKYCLVRPPNWYCISLCAFTYLAKRESLASVGTNNCPRKHNEMKKNVKNFLRFIIFKLNITKFILLTWSSKQVWNYKSWLHILQFFSPCFDFQILNFIFLNADFSLNFVLKTLLPNQINNSLCKEHHENLRICSFEIGWNWSRDR